MSIFIDKNAFLSYYGELVKRLFHPPPIRSSAMVRCTVLVFLSLVGCGCEPSTGASPARPAISTQSFSSHGCARGNRPATQPADLGVCRFNHGRRMIDRDAMGWIQAIADEPGSTIEIISATLYGVRADGQLEPIAGTGIGQPAIVWAGYWSRSPWFPPGDRHQSIAPFTRTTVDTRSVLHAGASHGDITHYVDAIFIVEARTTGDASIQIGIDFRADENDQQGVNERALSDWFRSSGYDSCAHSTPRQATTGITCTFN